MCGNKKALFVSFDDQPVYCSFPKTNGATLYTYTLRLEDSDLGPGADRSHLTEGHFYLLIGSRDSQLNHFTRELVDFCLFSVWHSRVHYSASRTIFATTFDVSQSPIHRLSYAVLFMSVIVAVAEKSGGKVQGA